MPITASRKPYTYFASRSARLKLGRTLAAEMGDLIDRLGPKHPQLNEALLRYIQNLDTRHPEWAALWDRGAHSAPELEG